MKYRGVAVILLIPLVYLPQDILLKVDRASMAYSLKTRAPFLDSKVVEAAFSMPSKWHRHGFSGKRVLKDVFKHYLPDNIWNRNKQGFAVPIHKWFRGDLGIQLGELLETVDSAKNADFVRQMLQRHQSKRRDYGYQLWSAYIFDTH